MSSDTEGTPTADVVVVGSGSAGAVVARRLVDAGASVLLLEAGLPDDNPAIHDPARLFELWDSEQDWGYRTVPQVACAGRELHWPRGRVLGGSSALNGMIYVRGHRGDYDGWAASRERRLGIRRRPAALQALRGLRPRDGRVPRRRRAPAGDHALRAAPGDRGGRGGGPGGRRPVQRRLERRRARGRRLLPAEHPRRTAPRCRGGLLASRARRARPHGADLREGVAGSSSRAAAVSAWSTCRAEPCGRRGPGTRSSSARARSSRQSC